MANALNGRPVVRFDGAGDSLNLPNVMNGATAGEAFVVLKSTRVAGQAQELWKVSSRGNYYNGESSYFPTSNQIYDSFGRTSSVQFGPRVALDQTQIYNVAASATEWTARQNGLMVGRAAGGTVAFLASPVLGYGPNYEAYGGNTFQGDIAEVVMYDRVLTDAEREAVNVYLTMKYAPPGVSAPVAPQLEVQALTSTSADLSWSVASGANQYLKAIVERQVDNGAFQELTTVYFADAARFNYTDTGLTAGSTYGYRIKLQSYVGVSAYSNIAPVTLPVALGVPPTSGLRLWLSASTRLQVDDAGMVWPDQSGRGNHATQATIADQPVRAANALNGRPMVRFDGIGDSLNLPDVMNGANAGEAFVVLKSTRLPGSYQELWKFSATGNYYSGESSYFPSWDGRIYESFGRSSAVAFDATQVTPSQVQIYNVAASSAEWAVRQNGLVVSRTAGAAAAFLTSPVLGRGLYGGNSFEGDIAEVVMYDRALTDAERDIVNAYLYAKYAPPGIVVPPVPAVSLVGTDWNSVALSWSVPAPGTLYYTSLIERRLSGGTFAQIAELPMGVASYRDTTVADATAYEYRVRLKNYAGSSAYGNTVAATTAALPRAGMKLWLSANELPAGPLDQWQDRSGLGNHATAPTALRRPTVVAAVRNGLPVVRFDGVDDALQLPAILGTAQSAEILALVKINPLPLPAVNRLWKMGANDTGSSYINTARYEDFGTDQTNLHTGSTLASEYHLVSLTLDGGVLKERINNVINWQSPVAVRGFPANPVIGASLLDPNIVLSGDLAEVMVYDRSLTSDEREVLLKGFIAKYNLPVDVPAKPALIAVVNSTTQILLKWTPLPATLYTRSYLERQLAGGAFAPVAVLENQFTYADSGLQSGAQYVYRVRVESLSGLSAYSDPALANTPPVPVVISTGDSGSFAALPGTWVKDGGGLVARVPRGSFDYACSVDAGGLYALELEASESDPRSTGQAFTFDVYLRDVYLGSLSVNAGYKAPAKGRIYIPWLQAGVHPFRFVWRNIQSNSFVKVHGISLIKPSSVDANTDGEPDWIAPYLATNFDFETRPSESYVSPAFIEGKSAWPAFIQADATAQTSPLGAAVELVVKEGLTGRFYANAPLNPDSPTRVRVREAGGLRTVTRDITWLAYNLLPMNDYPVLVRLGDSIRVEAPDALQPSSPRTLCIVDPAGVSSTQSFTASESPTLQFSSPGVYEVFLTPSGAAERRVLRVTVRDVRLGAAPAVFAGSYYDTTWMPLSVSAEATLQSDPSISVYGSGGSSYQLSASSAGRIVSRLYQDGPVTDSVRVDPISYNYQPVSVLTYMGTAPDGSASYRGTIDLDGPIPPGLTITLAPFNGAVFANGAGSFTLNASHLDSSGRYTYFLYTTSGKCHSIYFSVDGKSVLSL